MEILPREAERQAFLFWMRTGRRLEALRIQPYEQKFNPNHDPENGQFTSGGGSFGGGGAQSAWEPNKPAERSRAKPAARRSAPKPGPLHPELVRRAAAAVSRRSGQAPKTVEKNGYRYVIDSANRTQEASGNLTLGPVAPRSRSAQVRAGGPDRLPGDDGGHFIARRFNGPSDAFNHFAQSARFNRGAYRALEDVWARSLRKRKSVLVRITAHYSGHSQRPLLLDVHWSIDGSDYKKIFSN